MLDLGAKCLKLLFREKIITEEVMLAVHFNSKVSLLTQGELLSSRFDVNDLFILNSDILIV